MLKVLSNILCDLDPKVKVTGQKAGICDGVPSTSALVCFTVAIKLSYFTTVNYPTTQLSYLPTENLAENGLSKRDLLW